MNKKQAEESAGPTADIPPIPVDAESLEGTIRVLKAGVLNYAAFIKEWRLTGLAEWIKEQEDKFDVDAGRNPDERGGELIPKDQTEEEKSTAENQGESQLEFGGWNNPEREAD